MRDGARGLLLSALKVVDEGGREVVQREREKDRARGPHAAPENSLSALGAAVERRVIIHDRFH